MSLLSGNADSHMSSIDGTVLLQRYQAARVVFARAPKQIDSQHRAVSASQTGKTSATLVESEEPLAEPEEEVSFMQAEARVHTGPAQDDDTANVAEFLLQSSDMLVEPSMSFEQLAWVHHQCAYVSHSCRFIAPLYQWMMQRATQLDGQDDDVYTIDDRLGNG